MPINFHVARADLHFEAGFSEPEFELFRDTAELSRQLFKSLEPHGARLSDIRIERGAGSAADFHVLCYLFNFWMTIRIRVDRIEIICSEFPQDYVEKFSAAIVDTLGAVHSFRPGLSFRAYALVIGLHGTLEGKSTEQFLSRFAANIPTGLGPSVGSGTVMYFGPESERQMCALTVDRSAVVQDALFVRTHVVWDAKRVESQNLPTIADAFVRQALTEIGLQLPR
jgi:hypothetical protein